MNKRKWLTEAVGEGKSKRGKSVENLQQLLIAAGENVVGGADGAWGSSTETALLNYQDKHAIHGVPKRSFVEPNDLVLLWMAYEGELLIPLPSCTNIKAINYVHDYFKSNQIKYNPGAERGQGDRAIYGVDGEPGWAYQTTSLKLKKGPVEMDCTTYVNLMISVFLHGHVHVDPYDARCGDYGGLSAKHIARDRYSMPLVSRTLTVDGNDKKASYFRTAEQIAEATKAYPNKLFQLEVANKNSWAVKHMAIMFNGRVYECTTGQVGAACIDRTLADFMSNKANKIIYLFGPK